MAAIFDIDFEEHGMLKLHVAKFFLHPDSWNDPASQIVQNLKWKEVKFEDSMFNSVPNNKKGVYCFVVKPSYKNFITPSYLFYIGKTTRDFRQRFSEYLRNQKGKDKPRQRVFKMLTLYKDCLYFNYAHISSDKDIDEIEIKLLNTFSPEINTDIPKAKVKPELKDLYR